MDLYRTGCIKLPAHRCYLGEGWWGPPGTGWTLCSICMGVKTVKSQNSPWPLSIQPGIHGPPAQVSLCPSSPCGQLLSRLCCWVIEQLPGYPRQFLGMFQFPISMWLKQMPPPSLPLSLLREVITLQTLSVALVMTTIHRPWPCIPSTFWL